MITGYVVFLVASSLSSTRSLRSEAKRSTPYPIHRAFPSLAPPSRGPRLQRCGRPCVALGKSYAGVAGCVALQVRSPQAAQ